MDEQERLELVDKIANVLEEEEVNSVEWVVITKQVLNEMRAREVEGWDK